MNSPSCSPKNCHPASREKHDLPETTTLKEVKAYLLSNGTARITGEEPEKNAESHAGPGAGKRGSVFFSDGCTRVRLSLDDKSPVEIKNFGKNAEMHVNGRTITGFLEPAAWHCPKQAYITVSEGCIFGCRFCAVPKQDMRVKTAGEIEEMVGSVKDWIECISITSGVAESPEEDEEQIIEILKRLDKFGLPIGVSIYPAPDTPARLHDAGVREVKFNLETATDRLFREICKGTDRDAIKKALSESVRLFGKNRVFSNVILGLGETDVEMKECISGLCMEGVIPVIRPLTPSGELSGYRRPSEERIRQTSEFLKNELEKYGLDTTKAHTMCTKCTGCDLVPGRDL
ncbi:biotin synthase-related radical SAM superfamily protein [Methanomicrobium sp. W14]|uniref:radical SAM protein n=1 Tax=Methanomicrobium sp. W14 TaxID=2817839 RepID=UPI001AE23AA0|nr:radical SAM protein [Methanomicrobium sp. W14]MBP2134072.1 biotin synthase-related radical SAM superfamily protein [Methanomicrobium sp. W14]